jgi:hypothetical protein
LALGKQLIGNVDEVTDVRLVGGRAAAPTHLAVATNSEAVHIFDLQNLSCTASCQGHRDTVLTLDAAFGVGPQGEWATSQHYASNVSVPVYDGFDCTWMARLIKEMASAWGCICEHHDSVAVLFATGDLM